MKSNKGSSHTGRFNGSRKIPRSATFNVGRSPLGQHPTFSQVSKKKTR